MGNLRYVLALVLTLTAVFSSLDRRVAVRAQSATAQQRFVGDELIVKYRPGTVERGKSQARARVNAVALLNLARTPAAQVAGGVELVRIPPGLGLERAIAALRQSPDVEYAEPNWVYAHAALPNDPAFAQQWALENSGQVIAGQGGATADADVDAPEAWDRAPGAAPAIVGVIDEGVDINHEDLGVQPGGPIWTNPYEVADGKDNDGNGYVDDIHGWDFASGDNTVYDGSAAAPDVDSHGTHVAGTIGARWGNGLGIAGVSPGVVIIPAKFLGPAGGTTAGAILAIDYFTDLKIRHNLNIVATNNSWGGGGYSQALLEAIARAARHDILFIAAAGNGGPDGIGDDNDAVATYPAGYDTTAAAGYDAVISVTATGRSDEVPSWANYGAATVDIGAPGVLIASTTPQNTYRYSNGTSMATPHVSAAAALVHAARGLSGAALKAALLKTVDAKASLAGKASTRGRLNLRRAVAPDGTGGSDPASDPSEIVLYASRAATVAGNWKVQADSTAAGGARIQSVNLGAAKVAPALASPANYFEMTFTAEAGKPYRLWLRGKAEANGWANDSVHVQFSGAVNAAGAPIYRIGGTSGAEINLEDCSGCGLSGWGWQDNGYGAGVHGPAIYFATTGPQQLRVQIREDGLGIDQIVLSSGKYLSTAPGALKNDSTILTAGSATTAPSPSPPPAADLNEIVLYATDAATVAGRWARINDTTAAGNARMQNANAGAAKIVTPLAAPTDYFELTFNAEAGKRYRLWIRGKAEANAWANDSVHVQFSDSVTAAGAAVYRIGTASAAEINLEDCSSCGVAGWGWQDTGYGAGALGPEIRFATTGVHTVRIQVREDGLGIDQIVLSAGAYITTAPGTLKNDGTILPRTGG